MLMKAASILMFIGLLGGRKEAQKSTVKFQENVLPEKVF
jgi:hypothetical protein